MNSDKSDSKKGIILADMATNPLQYDSDNLDWKKEGMSNSPTRQFFIEYLEKNIENLNNKSIIDIGSGTGHFTKLYRKFGAKKIYGIEPSHKNIKISRKLYPEMIVYETKLEKIRIKKRFDVAIVVMAFEHMSNLDLSFQQIAKLMKPAGTFYTIVGDKKYFTTERFGYTIKIRNLKNNEVAIATWRPYGVMYDISRPILNFIKAAEKNDFNLIKNIQLTPTEKFIKTEPKYKEFKGKPLAHLLIFKYNK